MRMPVFGECVRALRTRRASPSPSSDNEPDTSTWEPQAVEFAMHWEHHHGIHSRDGTDWGLVVALAALAFSLLIASFWWLYARTGKLEAPRLTVPRSGIACAFGYPWSSSHRREDVDRRQPATCSSEPTGASTNPMDYDDTRPPPASDDCMSTPYRLRRRRTRREGIRSSSSSPISDGRLLLGASIGAPSLGDDPSI